MHIHDHSISTGYGNICSITSSERNAPLHACKIYKTYTYYEIPYGIRVKCFLYAQHHSLDFMYTRMLSWNKHCQHIRDVFSWNGYERFLGHKLLQWFPSIYCTYKCCYFQRRWPLSRSLPSPWYRLGAVQLSDSCCCCHIRTTFRSHNCELSVLNELRRIR